MVYFASHHWSKERICCVLFLRMFPNLCWVKSYCFQACSHLHHTRWWWRCLTRQKLENLPVRQKWSWIFCGDLTKSGQIMSNLTKQNAGSYTCVSGHVDLLIIQESRDVNPGELHCLFRNNDSGHLPEKFAGCVHMWPVKLLLLDHFGRLPSLGKSMNICFIETQGYILFMTTLWNLQVVYKCHVKIVMFKFYTGFVLLGLDLDLKVAILSNLWSKFDTNWTK